MVKKKTVKTAAEQNQVFQNNLYGIGMMVMHVIALSLLYAVSKLLTKDISSNLVVFLYKFCLLVCMIPWCFVGGLKSLKTDRLGLHLARAFLSVGGALCMFYALKHLKLADATAIQFLEHILMLIIGIVYFREQATKTKFGVIIISFVGALLVVKPDYITHFFTGEPINSEFNMYYVFVFMALGFWSLNSTFIKILGRTEKTKSQTFYVLLFSSIIAYPTAFMNWDLATTIGPIDIRYPVSFIPLDELGLEVKHIGLIAILAGCYFVHVITHFKAFKHAEVSAIIPFEYTRLIFAAILGYLIFSDLPTKEATYGYALIIIGGLILLRAESRKMKRKKLEALKEEFSN